MRVHEDITELPDGSPGLYGWIEKAPSAIIVALDDDGVWLVEQFRHPVGERFWEFPQGAWEGVSGDPEGFEYWSLARRFLEKNPVLPTKDMTAEEFLGHAYGNFARAAEKWLTGSEPFTAKLNPAYAPYGDYDQLMRLEEWYGRK